MWYSRAAFLLGLQESSLHFVPRVVDTRTDGSVVLPSPLPAMMFVIIGFSFLLTLRSVRDFMNLGRGYYRFG
jgi:hypothetical protein